MRRLIRTIFVVALVWTGVVLPASAEHDGQAAEQPPGPYWSYRWAERTEGSTEVWRRPAASVGGVWTLVAQFPSRCWRSWRRRRTPTWPWRLPSRTSTAPATPVRRGCTAQPARLADSRRLGPADSRGDLSGYADRWGVPQRRWRAHLAGPVAGYRLAARHVHGDHSPDRSPRRRGGGLCGPPATGWVALSCTSRLLAYS